jgi:hypothetical protein
MTRQSQDDGGADPLVRAAMASASLPRLLAHGSRAVINGIWLGVLSDQRLRTLDERYYATSPLYRTPEWNERGLFPWERDLFAAFLPAGGRILVVACGGGREVLALRRDGYDAFGTEPHPALARFAAEFMGARGHASSVAPARRDELGGGRGPWDAVVIGWGAYSLVHSRVRREALLVEAKDRIPSGNPVLLSYFERPPRTREPRWTKAVADPLRRVRRRPPVELGDTLGPNMFHVFTRDEIAAEASAAGFDVVCGRTVSEIDSSIAYACAALRSRP